MVGSNEEGSNVYKLDDRALKKCGAGIRQLLLMEDKKLIEAKERDQKRLKVELERLEKARKKARESGRAARRKPLRSLPEPSPHLILGPVIIDRLRVAPIKIRAIVRFAGNADDLEAMGIKVHSYVHDVFTITATKKQLADLASQPATSRINLPRKFHWLLRDAVPQAEIDQIQALGSGGQGTIVGVIDSTLDVKHHTFRDPAAPHDTRVLYMWVQEPILTGAGAAPPGETPEQYSAGHPGSPNFTGLNYGRIYDAGAINTALGLATTYGTGANQIATVTPDQTSVLGQHGTHVTGIAAGSGHDDTWAQGNDIGAAPLADIAFVAYDLDEDHAIDALNFVYAVAANQSKPAVANMSFGSQVGPHDGSSSYDGIKDAMLFSHDGRAMVCGAGNDNSFEGFRKGTIGAGLTEPVWNLHPNYPTVNVILRLWYKGPGLDFQVSCGGASTGWKTTGQGYYSNWEGGAIRDGLINGYQVYIYRDYETPSDWNNLLLWIPEASSADDWTIELRNPGTSGVNYWAWLDNMQYANLDDFRTDEMTLLDTACSKGILAVGACNKPVGGNPEVIWDSSGCGPTQDSRIKPEITAVGVNISSAESGSTGDGGYVGFVGGTSMSAPLVSGAIALLFENQPNLNQDTIKGLLTQTADRTGLNIDAGALGYDETERNQYGFGRLRMLAPFHHSLPLVYVDVWIRTADDDYGLVPYPGDCFCHAPEIWVYNSAGSEVTTVNWGQEHRVRVRVHNLGDTPAINTRVSLKYTRPWAAPDAWTPCQDASNHPIEQTVNIPALDYYEFDFTQRWRPEQSELPPGGAEWGDHYCLLVELDDDDDDPLVYDDSTAAGRDPWNKNIEGTNNVALRNVTIQ